MSDDECRTFFFFLCHFQGLTDFCCIVAVDGDDLPSPGFIFFGCIFVGYFIHFGRKLDIIRVIEHDQVSESECTGNTSCTLGDLFLNATVRDESIGLVGHPFTETGYQKTFGDSCSDGHGMSLTQRT